MSTTAGSDDGEDLDDLLFSGDGHWREAQHDWGNPEDALRQVDFMKVLEPAWRSCRASRAVSS